jgi:hypothetical protein
MTTPRGIDTEEEDEGGGHVISHLCDQSQDKVTLSTSFCRALHCT